MRGLGIVRSLGRRGIPVWVLTDAHSMAAASRYCRRTLQWPAGDETQRLNYLFALAEKYHLQGWALYPTEDEDVALVARHHKALAEQFALTTPDWEIMRWAYDKRFTYELAERVGVNYPWTYYPASREELAALECAYPVILKPAFKEGFSHFAHDKAWRVENRDELLARYDEACKEVAPEAVMVQELIPGGGETQFSYAALCKEGRSLAWLVARRARQYPIDFGRASTYVETVHRPEIEEPARRLLAEMGFTGLIEVEFKRDPRSDCYKLLDLNARVWGWHTLGDRAGVDFSYLLWRMVHGEELAEVRGRTGVRWIRMLTDLPAVARGIRGGTLSVREFLGSFRRPMEFAVFAFDDPVPALVEIPLLVRIIWKRGAI